MCRQMIDGDEGPTKSKRAYRASDLQTDEWATSTASKQPQGAMMDSLTRYDQSEHWFGLLLLHHYTVQSLYQLLSLLADKYEWSIRFRQHNANVIDRWAFSLHIHTHMDIWNFAPPLPFHQLFLSLIYSRSCIDLLIGEIRLCRAKLTLWLWICQLYGCLLWSNEDDRGQPACLFLLMVGWMIQLNHFLSPSPSLFFCLTLRIAHDS